MPRPAVGTSGIPSGGVPGEITGWAPDEVDVPDRDVLIASGSAISAAAVATRGAAVVTIGGSVGSPALPALPRLRRFAAIRVAASRQAMRTRPGTSRSVQLAEPDSRPGDRGSGSAL